MNYKIHFIPDAVSDYKLLDGRIKKLVNGKIDKLKTNPFLGEALGNRNNIDLRGFYKIYIDKKTFRLIYRITGDEVEIIEIWGIGKRDKLEIYQIIGQRLKK